MVPESAKKNKKPPVRRNAEARREQNRIASRNYREKRKQKLKLLNQLLDPGDDDGDGAREAFEGGPSSTSESVTLSETTLDSNHVDASPSSQSPAPPFYEPEYVFTIATPLDSLASESELTPLTTIEPTSLSLDSSQQARSDADGSVLAILDSIRHLSHGQKTELLRHLQTQVTASPGSPSTSSVTSSQQGPGNWVSQLTRYGTAETRLQLEARRFAKFINQHAAGVISPAQLSRVYAAESGLFGAIFANCYALGMNDVEPLMVEDGVSVFCLGPDTGYKSSQLPVVRSKFNDLTPDLQPCDIQLTFGHHPYLDVLPWKTFRKRALEVLRQDPTLLDEEELCRDICTGGLICWGAQQNSMGMEAGVPWDMRSWEPTVWFLKKYQSLVGGWDDEMWKGARWWHNARGQKLLI